MFTRIFSTFAAISLLTACGSDSGSKVEVDENSGEQGLNGGKITCAVNGQSDFSDGCQAERLSAENGVILVVHHPDGGFRRFNILTDGRGIEVADGAEEARIEIVRDDEIIVNVGSDKYILPARMKTSETVDESAAQAGN